MEGQIVKILSNLYFVESNQQIYECHSRGKFRNQKITPIVGDFVVFDEKQNYILEILPRKNALVRPLVANIDQGLLVTSLTEPDFSDNLLDKLLVVMHVHDITPIICITKQDLLPKKEKRELYKLLKAYEKAGYKVFKNTDKFRLKRIFNGKTTVFTGQTGAGKSSLLNRLDKNLHLKTGEISRALGRGKHTTRHVELMNMYKGKVVDTPGFSSIDLSTISKDKIKDAFIEFRKYSCPYKDCKHLNEKECAVKKAVEEGKILRSRYENYRKFMMEK